MVIITYVSQNPLETSFNSFFKIQDGRQIKNGRHFTKNGILLCAFIISRFS